RPARRARRLREVRRIGRSCLRCRLQPFPQAMEAIANPTFNGSERFFERLGNFGVTEAFEIGELDGALLLRLQAGQEVADLRYTALIVELLFKSRSGTNRGQLFGLIFAASLPLTLEAKRIEGAVARHGKQPWEERAAGGVVARGVAP